MRQKKELPILPGATIGILGSGQLGRMLAIAASRLGYYVNVYSPELILLLVRWLKQKLSVTIMTFQIL